MRRLLVALAVLALIQGSTHTPIRAAYSSLELGSIQLQSLPPISGQLIQRVYPDKARYPGGATAVIKAELTNNTGSAWSGTVALVVLHLEATVFTTSQNVSLGVGASTTVTFNWTTPGTDFQGYLAEVTAGTIDYGATAIDVSSTWTRYPRYGYSDDFPSSETSAQSTTKMQDLQRDYGIDAVQFYDWMWRHEQLIQRTGGQMNATWTDWSGKVIASQTILNQIAAAHGLNQAAMAYSMVYGGLNNYQSISGVDPTWGMYTDATHTNQDRFDFGPGFPGTSMYLFAPDNPDWQNYITNQYNDAIATLGFDGVHLDQLGQRDGRYDYWGNGVDLANSFAPLLQASRDRLGPASKSTYNIVNGGSGTWAEYNVARYGGSDFDYAELWENTTSYQNLKDTVAYIKANDGNKAVVLAGYMNYYEDAGTTYEAETATRNGVTTNTNHPGYTGTGFVDGFDAVGDYVQFSITTSEAGNYSLVFRYGNATGSTATRDIVVDGSTIATLKFFNQPNWDTWAYDAYALSNLTAGTHTVKILFSSSNSTAINLDNLFLGTFEPNRVRLADAARAAAGAYHIEMGPNGQMLAHPYFSNRSKQMRNALKTAMKDQYTFITAYENLLFDPDVQNVDSGTQFTTITGQPTSGNGAAGTIWTYRKRSAGYDLVHLINLIGNDDQWRNTAATLSTLSNLATKVYLGPNATVSGVYIASPDRDHGAPTSLTYSTGSDATGSYVSFTVPALQYWDTVLIKRTFTAPTGDRYEAESAVKTGVTTNTNHLGYTGTGFVDGFTATNTGVSFTVTAPADDSYTLQFRYANATGANATRGVVADGGSLGQISFRTLWNWDIWGTSSVTTHLSAGTHSVVLWFGTSDATAINLDNVVVVRRTDPSTTSVASLYVSNWQDELALWMASKLNQNDTGTYGPRIAELHYSPAWSTNQIVDYTGYFRDETNARKYTQAHNFDSEGWFESDGTLTTNYLNYSGAATALQLSRDHAFPQNQSFLITKYILTNPTASSVTQNVLDSVHLNNLQKGQGTNVHAWYDATRNVLFADMTGSGQYVVFLGAFQTTDSHQAGNDTDSNVNSTTAAPWYTFDNNGTLKNNNDITVPDVSMGFQKQVAVGAGASTTVSFYIGVRSTVAAAQSAADTARAQTADYWFAQVASSASTWLNAGRRTTFADAGLNNAYDRSLLMMKNTQRPGQAWPATTNPGSYGYKVWVRDSSVTAMSLDAALHTAEADTFWRWMASVQNTDGTWHTNYDLWSNNWISFVEPEHDAIGMFLIGAWRHYQITNDRAFLDAVWPQIQLSANFVNNGIGSNGFGPSDHSIWEEDLEYNAFTEALYVDGLNAAAQAAKVEGNTTLYDSWNGGAGTISTALQKTFLSSPSGMWNSSNRYFDRAVTTGNVSRQTVDSSSDALYVFGLLDPSSARVRDHVARVASVLTHDTWGVARYQGDTYYYTSQYSPAGNEALGPEPSWPQMSMYLAIWELQQGRAADALQRLQWYASRSAKGWVAPGEAVSNVSRQPILSTTAEPLTAAAYVITALDYLGLYAPALLARQYNAGTNKAITVSSGTAGDWLQWRDVSYFLDATGDGGAGGSMTDLKRVYVANDASNVYLRIDNLGGTLSAFNVEPKWAIFVYAEDFDHSGSVASRSTGYYGATLDRAMQYLVARWSDSTSFSKFVVSGGNWTFSSNITSVIAPQWDAALGRIEVVIPISALSSTGGSGLNRWSNLNISFGFHNVGPNTWSDADLLAVHYRLTDTSTAPIVGNLER